MKMIRVPAAALALTILAATSAFAQAPPEGTGYAECKANKDWRWVGTSVNDGKCRRKVGKYARDKFKQVKEKLKKN